MPLINCKLHLELGWSKNRVMFIAPDNNNNNTTTFKITSTKLYVPIVILSTKDNVNLTKQLNEGFKRSVYRNEHKSKIGAKTADKKILQDFLLMLLFKELIDSLVLLLITLLRMMLMMPKNQLTRLLIEFKETIIENIFFQEHI